MIIFGQISNDWVAIATKAAMVVAGVLVLYWASKVGLFFLKVLFGLVGFALLGLAVWWFFLKH